MRGCHFLEAELGNMDHILAGRYISYPLRMLTTVAKFSFRVADGLIMLSSEDTHNKKCEDMNYPLLCICSCALNVIYRYAGLTPLDNHIIMILCRAWPFILFGENNSLHNFMHMLSLFFKTFSLISAFIKIR